MSAHHTPDPVPRERALAPLAARPLARRPNPVIASVARRAVPTVTTSAGALVTSLAVERAMARVVTVALGRLGQTVAATPFSMIVPRVGRDEAITVVTETTIVERISRRR